MPETPQSQSERIAELNDTLRTTGQGGEVFMTWGVSALEEATRQKVILAVKNFDVFNEDNDPYGEHDFGAVEVEGDKYFWKVDYYDRNHPNQGSENPADPDVTRRVMMIMQASEY